MDPETEKLLDQLARETGSSKSEAIRLALRLAARKKRGTARPIRPYDQFRGVLGSVRGGPPDLSERTGERFRRLLVGRQRKAE
jgi:hypothetical protein